MDWAISIGSWSLYYHLNIKSHLSFLVLNEQTQIILSLLKWQDKNGSQDEIKWSQTAIFINQVKIKWSRTFLLDWQSLLQIQTWKSISNQISVCIKIKWTIELIACTSSQCLFDRLKVSSRLSHWNEKIQVKYGLIVWNKMKLAQFCEILAIFDGYYH